MIILTQLAQNMICNKANKKNTSISMKLCLFSLDPNSEKMDGFYKAENCMNDIAFGVYLFVSCELNAYFQL